MKLTTILLASWLLLVAHLSSCDAHAEPTPKAVESARSQFKLPKMFDFDRYQEIFSKMYLSMNELLVRQKIFMARAFRAFISGIKYKYGLASSYLRVNSRSDWTMAEVDGSKMKAGRRLFESRPEAYEGIQPVNVLPVEQESDVSLMDEEQLKNQIDELAKSKDSGVSAILGEIVNRKKRYAEPKIPRHDLSMDDLIPRGNSPESPEVAAKINKNPIGNNPNYVEPEIASFGDAEIKTLRPISYYTVISEAMRDETSEAIKSIFSSLAGSLTSVLSFGRNSNVQVGGLDSSSSSSSGSKAKNSNNDDGRDGVFIDHRQSNCFFQPRDQGDCSSCYAFSFISLLEWMHCKETGELVAFSEQYIVDCGHRTGLWGCEGGDFTKVANFGHFYGLELLSSYPYNGHQDACPYSPEVEPEKMGFLRIDIAKSAIVPADAFVDVLKSSPIVVGVATKGTNFDEYGGGVADGRGCPKEEDHAMLLVGHGREDSIDYWLLRNSHSASFGEGGYYKLAKSSGCIRTKGFVFGSVDGKNFKITPKRNELYHEIRATQRQVS